MIVWRITGNEIGPGGNGAMYFALKKDADDCRKAWMSDAGGTGGVCDPPEKITVKDRDALAKALNDAMGYGAS